MTPTELRADFPADPTSAAKARRFVAATLRNWSCETFVDVATLLVSELVSNAVLHTGTSLTVVIRRNDERLRIEVHDGSARLPVAKHYSALSGTGRGLLLMERMADQWGAAPDDTGKTVWFELETSNANDADPFGAFDLDEIDLDDFDDLGGMRGAVAPRNDVGRASGDVGPRALVFIGR